MRTYLTKWRNEQRGQAMVEFAAVLPLLLLLVLACMEFGWYFYTRSAVNQFAADSLQCVPDPSFYLSWGSDRGWRKLSEEPAPSWMTAEELAVWNSGNYIAWASYQDLSVHLADEFEKNLQTLPTALRRENIQVSPLRGGWFLTMMAQQIPKENLQVGKPITTLDMPRSEYYYCDVEIEITYPFRPLSFLGKAFFCRDGAETSPIKAKYRTERNVGQTVRTYG